ncbi:hypothetical protein CFIMG_007236RA00001 [Ceratocystis fimbriata CBS 114723]|uniref:SUN domain-containing protein n=1 Tax=Ceratocystis fimbriata CBS 114723 TaxID=1035309 RepID=A0A2C5WKH5_9PEZI|nr:hypothetical protein CFIMG_007236RA00001 [Ceratocystis fimbriata CBS 114723]
MPSRVTRSRPAADSILATGAAIKDDLPPLPTRFTSTYGAQVTYAIYNPLKGRRRDLQTAIDHALRNQDDDADSIDSELMEQLMQETPAARRSRKETALRARAKSKAEADSPTYTAAPASDSGDYHDEDTDVAATPVAFTRRQRVLPARRREEERIQREKIQQQLLDDAQISGHEDSQLQSDQEEEEEPDEEEQHIHNATKEEISIVEEEPVSAAQEPTSKDQEQVTLSHKLELERRAREKRSDASDASFNREGGLYGEASFKHLLKRAVASVASLLYKGSLGLIVVVFWAALLAWISAHYTVNPALAEWDVVWDNSNGLWENVAQFSPLVPIAPLSHSTHNEGSFDGNNSAIISAFSQELKRQKKKLASLETSNSLNTEARERLQKMLPDLIVVERDGGKLRLPSNLYHAIRDDLIKDGIFFNMGKNHGGKFEISSPRQWEAMMHRIDKEGYAKKSDISPLEPGVTSEVWREFRRQNDKLLAEIKKSIPVAEIANVPDSKVVTRSKLIEEMDAEFARTKKMMRTELETLEERLMKKLETAIKAAGSTTSAAYMTRSEVTALINTMLRKAVSEGQLNALADREIRSDFNSVLTQQVNFFSPGAGAQIIPQLTSPHFNNEDVKRNREIKGSGAQKTAEGVSDITPASALSDWTDDGQCWCGSIGITRRGERQGTIVSVQLSRYIVPEHIVLEHIVKGATLDEPARPRDIEVWAYIEDLTIRERVDRFISKYLPKFVDEDGKPIGNPSSIDGYVKIGVFTFPASEHSREYIHRLSPDLAELGVETTSIRVVAATNYGDKDKTCFYRIRMYGQIVDKA